MLFAFLPVLIGMVGRVAHSCRRRPDLVLPTVLTEQLPPWLGALALAAVFSTEVDTCDAILFMISTSVSKDLFQRFMKPDASDRELLLVARMSAVAGGVLGVLLSIYLSTIVQAMTVFYSLLGVSLFVPVLGGLYLAARWTSGGAGGHRRGRHRAARGTLWGCRTLPVAGPDAERAHRRGDRVSDRNDGNP